MTSWDRRRRFGRNSRPSWPACLQTPLLPHHDYSDFRVTAPGVLVVEFNHPEMTGTVHFTPVIEDSHISTFTCRVEGFPSEWVPEGCDS